MGRGARPQEVAGRRDGDGGGLHFAGDDDGGHGCNGEGKDEGRREGRVVFTGIRYKAGSCERGFGEGPWKVRRPGFDRVARQKFDVLDTCSLQLIY